LRRLADATRTVIGNAAFWFSDVGKVGLMRGLFAASQRRSGASVLTFERPPRLTAGHRNAHRSNVDVRHKKATAKVR
jgi:hypothetical protein